MFFSLDPSSAIISDANRHLISTYRWIRDQPKKVGECLQRHASAHGEEHYYRVRLEYNLADWSASQAARFIYLNHTCFGGIFRVNKQGAFNVPYGWKETPNYPTREELLALSARLKCARILHRDFGAVLKLAKKGDFIYLDPPYPPLNGTAYFTHYTMDRFGHDDQMRLAKVVRQLNRRGCLIMMSNADTPAIRKMYKGFTIKRLPVTRFVSTKLTKHSVYELVITNY